MHTFAQVFKDIFGCSIFFSQRSGLIWRVFISKSKEDVDIGNALSNLIYLFNKNFIADPILYLSMILGLGGVNLLISSLNDDEENLFIISKILI